MDLKYIYTIIDIDVCKNMFHYRYNTLIVNNSIRTGSAEVVKPKTEMDSVSMRIMNSTYIDA